MTTGARSGGHSPADAGTQVRVQTLTTSLAVFTCTNTPVNICCWLRTHRQFSHISILRRMEFLTGQDTYKTYRVVLIINL